MSATGHIGATTRSLPGLSLKNGYLVIDGQPQNGMVESELSSSDDDSDESARKRFNTIIDDIRDGRLDLQDDVKLHQFADENEGHLGKKTGDGDGDTLLHLLVDEARDKLFDKYKPLVRLLIHEHPNLLRQKDGNEKTPLYKAIFKKRERLARFMCETCLDVDHILSIPSHRVNCLHAAIHRNVGLALTIFLISCASDSTLCAKDDKGNTPLHIAVEYPRCTDAQLDIVKAIVSRCDKTLDERTAQPHWLSPYRYHEYTRVEAEKQDAQSGEPTGKSGTDRRKNKSKDKATMESAGEVMNYLKLHCMRTRNHDECMDFLYGRDQGKQIFFDLYDYPLEKISEEYFDEGLRHLQFENVLQYVALRRMELDTNSTGKHVKPDGRGRNHMVFIFDFLRRKSVQQVIRVIVDDTIEPAHSDAAIEEALQQLKVEIWDWRKIDICSETILTAAPDTREAHLYWSGNNAVLRGWSEPEGLNRLAKLEKIYLRAEQGLETISRTTRNVTSFLDRISLLPRDIKIEVQVDFATDRQQSKPDQKPGPLDTSREQVEQHKWLECMEEFADFIQNVPLRQREPLMIALIDDGVDINEQSLHGKIADGRSFCHRDQSQNLSKPHYVTSWGHGTAMACLICRVFPMAQLYVLKLEEYMNEYSKRQITARSAAKAVQAAINKRVQIISMSWTIEKTENNAKDIEELESAIEAAAKAGILMFCAAHDQGVEHDRTYPAACGRTKHIFKIGAANAPGWPAEYVNPNEVDFIFPGHNVVKERFGDVATERSKPLTGSSVATAVAAGLAGLVLYCIQLGALYTETMEEQNRRGAHTVTMDDFRSIKGHERMKEAFRAIGVSQESGNKFIGVWRLFGPAAKRGKGKSEAVRMQIVTELVQKLKASMAS